MERGRERERGGREGGRDGGGEGGGGREDKTGKTKKYIPSK